MSKGQHQHIAKCIEGGGAIASVVGAPLITASLNKIFIGLPISEFWFIFIF